MVNPQLTGPNSDDKLWGGLSYVGLACCMIPTIVIFLLKKDESRYIKFHSLQALAIGVAGVVIGILLSVLGQIPVLGFLVGIVHLLFLLAFLGFWVYLMIQAFTGKDVQIPVLSDFINQNLMG